jgi:hypothetical protein
MSKTTELASGQITTTNRSSRSSRSPHNLKSGHRRVEPFEPQPAAAAEGKALAQRKVMQGAHDEDASGVGSRAQPRSKLHRGAEEVVTLGDRLTRGHPDADADRHSTGALCVLDSPLDLHGAFDGADDRRKRPSARGPCA